MILYKIDTFIKYPDFTLSGKKVLPKSDMGYESILVNEAERHIGRLKKRRVRNKKYIKNRNNKQS
jgi:hypothetical protein